MTKHWAEKYVGLRWEFGATGPDAFDCWTFFAHVQREQFGVIVPTISSPESWIQARELMETHPENRRWAKVEAPQEGDAVLMARNRVPVHIGVAVFANGRTGVLHCAQPSGVVFQLPEHLANSGWGRLTYRRRTL